MQLTKLANGNYQLTIELTPDVINGLLLNPLEMTNTKPVDKFFGLQSKTKSMLVELFSIYGSTRIDCNDKRYRDILWKHKFVKMSELLHRLEEKGYAQIYQNEDTKRFIGFKLFL
jgi:hypothetical protein